MTRWPWIAKTLDRLLGPHPAVAGDVDRLGARLFAGLMLVHVALVTVLLLAVNFFWSRATGLTIWHDLDFWTVVAALGVIAAAYGLLRSGHYRPALFVYVAATLAVPLVAPFVPDANAEIGLVASAIIPVLLVATVFPHRWVLGTLIFVVAALALQLLFSGMPLQKKNTGYDLMIVVAVTGSLLLVFRRHIARLQRRQLEQVRATEARYRLLFETITDGIMVTDGATRIVEVNDAICRQLGYQRTELLGRSAADISARPPGDVDEARKAILEKGHVVFETAHRRKDGSTMPVELALCSIVLDEEPAILAVARDLTERQRMEADTRRLENQLHQTVKMESIGQLAGGIAHDFNNLLTAILGNAELVLNDLPSDAPQAAPIQQILKAADSASSLTRQLLAFSRKQMIAPRQLDLNHLIGHTEKMLTRLIGEDVTLKTIAAPDLWPVHADPGLVEQMLINLSVNARDAMPDGGILVIQTANVSVNAEYHARHPEVEPGDYVSITVTDTGVGMSAEVMGRMFEPFFTTKPKGRGTGLGLATTWGAVRQSGGFIGVHSEPGRGTTFRIYLPRLRGAAATESAQRAPVAIPRGTETVLVVEDDAEVRALAVRILATLGYRVICAANGVEAIDAARAHAGPIALALTDVVMPGLNGRQTADGVVAIHPECRVLYTSGYTDDAIVHHGVLEDGVAFVAKPYTPLMLGTKVRETIDRP